MQILSGTLRHIYTGAFPCFMEVGDVGVDQVGMATNTALAYNGLAGVSHTTTPHILSRW